MHTDLLKALRLESSGVPIYVQLREQILRHLGAGVLTPGDQMPTMREVAVTLKVDLNTVRHAYDELERLGAITLVRGRGSFVAKPPPAMGARAQHRPPHRRRPHQNPRKAEGIVVMNNYFKAKGVNQPAIVLSILVAAAAAWCGWLGEQSGARSYYWIAGILAVVAALIPQSLMIADQWERAIVLRLGKLNAIRGPGCLPSSPSSTA
jgi:GntR family transcriptional regulator